MWKKIAVLGVFATAAYFTKKHFAGAKCRCIQRLDCRAVVITGATSGIGKALAFEIAKRGGTVVLGCRDIAAAQRVCEEVSAATGSPSVYALPLDLTSLASVREFARQVHKCEYDVYALVNNAGVFYVPQHNTQDEFDTTFQVNYLGGFLLSGLLIDLLQASAPSRIIFLSSQAHTIPQTLNLLDNDKPDNTVTKQLGLFELYGQTKLCVNLITKKLASLLRIQDICVVSVDPGNVETKIYRSFPLLSNPLLWLLQWPLRRVVVKTPKEGAQSLLHAVLCPDIKSGAHIKECKEIKPSDLSLNSKLADRLFQRSLIWSGLSETDFKPDWAEPEQIYPALSDSNSDCEGSH